jgi:hypothetical protein
VVIKKMDISKKMGLAIGIVVITIFLLALTPTIVSQVDVIITAGNLAGATKWNFTGAAGALTIMGLILVRQARPRGKPFVWVAAVLMCAIVGMWSIAKGAE